jgi:Ala-tRNA(Pro) deacylase
MAIAITLQQYLDDQGVTYDCLEHKRTGCSTRSAEASHVPSECLAKAVVLKGRDGYVLTIVPASRQVKLEEVGALLRQPIGLAAEAEIATLFPDCEPGAVPPVAAAYGLHCLVDESLEAQSDIYFEAGDHRTLVHLSGEQFRKLMQKVPHGHFAAGTGAAAFETKPISQRPDKQPSDYDI